MLGKKSWNVYNGDNIARVQADEAAAAAAEHAQEQRMQETDAVRRLAILRGETPPPLPEPEPEIDPSDKKFARRDKGSATGFSSRKRKRYGEDDTDFEMRLVKERAELGDKVAASIGGRVPDEKRREVEIVGRDGHIDLVGAPPESTEKKGKNAEYEKEAARKNRELEDQGTMRFSNAAGRDGLTAGDPWYASTSARKAAAASAAKQDEVGMEAPTKNVWGREDPERQDREVKRITSNDPLAMMKMGAKKVREIEQERKKENLERAKDLEVLRKDDRRREKRRRTEKRDSHSGRERDDGRRKHRRDSSKHSERHRQDKGEHRSRNRSDEDRSENRHGKRDRDREQSQTFERSSNPPVDGTSIYRQRRRRDDDDDR